MKHTVLAIFITFIIFKSLIKLSQMFDKKRFNKIFEKICIKRFNNKEEATVEIMDNLSENHEHSYNCACHNNFASNYFSLNRAIVYVALFAFLFKLISQALG